MLLSSLPFCLMDTDRDYKGASCPCYWSFLYFWEASPLFLISKSTRFEPTESMAAYRCLLTHD